jgi:hypothetical protein
VFSLRGPFSRYVIFLSTFLLLPCVIHPPPLFGPRGPPSFSSSTRRLPCVPLLSTSASRQRASPLSLISPLLLPVVFRHVPSSIALLTPRHFFHTLIVRRHHSCHAPHPSRWPPRPFVEPFSYSRWQREEPSISQNAELARSSSIPRKQLLKRLVVVRHRLRHNGKARP